MKLLSLIKPENVVLQADVKNGEEAIAVLVRQLSRSSRSIREEKILSVIHEREKLGGTALDSGLYIPHGRLEDFDNLIVGLLTPAAPFTAQGKSVRLMMICIAPSGTSNLYLLTLAAVNKIAMNETLLQELCRQSQVQDFLELIADIEVKKTLAVQDIMTERRWSITPDATLKDLADIYYTNRTSYAPVIDEMDNFIGEVRSIDLLKVGIPDYALMLGNLNFLKSFEPLEGLLQRETRMRVREIMRPVEHKLRPDSTVIEAAYLMTRFNRRQLPIVDDEERMIGLIGQIDLITRVIRG